jgi:hypothetical protein
MPRDVIAGNNSEVFLCLSREISALLRIGQSMLQIVGETKPKCLK